MVGQLDLIAQALTRAPVRTGRSSSGFDTNPDPLTIDGDSFIRGGNKVPPGYLTTQQGPGSVKDLLNVFSDIQDELLEEIAPEIDTSALTDQQKAELIEKDFNKYSDELAKPENRNLLEQTRAKGETLVLDHSIDGVQKTLIQAIAKAQGIDIGDLSQLQSGKTIEEQNVLSADQKNNLKKLTDGIKNEFKDAGVNLDNVGKTGEDGMPMLDLNKYVNSLARLKMWEEFQKFWVAQMAANLKAIHDSIKLAKSAQ